MGTCVHEAHPMGHVLPPVDPKGGLAGPHRRGVDISTCGLGHREPEIETMVVMIMIVYGEGGMYSLVRIGVPQVKKKGPSKGLS